MLNSVRYAIFQTFSCTRSAGKCSVVCALLVSLFFLTSCGFHLRSYAESTATIQQLSLDCPSTDSWELCHHLKQTLLLSGVHIVDDAPLTLVISEMDQHSRVLSLQSNASAAELGLASEVEYTIHSSHDDEVKHTQSVHINNSYRHESSALIAKDRERDELQMRLSQQLAEQIVRQIVVLDASKWLTPTLDAASQ